MEQVVLVNEKDEEIGFEEKLIAHKQGKLHRAFSILVFNSKNELLLQKRNSSKYHSGGLWSNTCCSHPGPGKEIKEVAHRKLKEEMGFDCELREVFSFIYRVQLGTLFENEYDHVFIGKYNGEVELNLAEAEGYRWEHIRKLIDIGKEKITIAKVFCNQQDFEFVSGFECYPTEISGGVILENPDSSERIDLSYETLIKKIYTSLQ